jgi:hypothetical protein
MYKMKRERENKMIDFITAKNSGIEMYSDMGVVGFAKTAKAIAYIAETKGLASTVYTSSSMDFADEEGFNTADGALTLWNEAMKIVERKM